MDRLLETTRFGACVGAVAVVLGMLVGCGSEPQGGPSEGQGGTGGSGGGAGGAGESAQCTPSVNLDSKSRSFIITDQEILAKFSLERVLQQMIDTTGSTSGALTPLALLQRFFDTENATSGAAFSDVSHCDSQSSFAFLVAPPTHCPRAEGALATNPNLLTAGDPNSFVPVAIVNRFDLTRASGISCGEYRLVYAKSSGKTNPEDRVFLIIEAFLSNPQFPDVLACKPIADMWASLDGETDLQVVSNKVENFFFTGLSNFGPVVHADNCGEKGPDDDGSYGGSRGQVRIGHKMQVPWEWREFHVKRSPAGSAVPLAVTPVGVKNNPLPERFDVAATPGDEWFRQEFIGTSLASLAAPEFHAIRMQAPVKSNMGQSAFEGAAASDYAARGSKSPGADFASQLDTQLELAQLGTSCPPDDPLTGKNILQRASMHSCAGCHAPQQFLEPGNSIGCGLTWPDSLGEVHIDENGQLSKALTDVFLPRRAEVLSKFVGGCSLTAINAVLQPVDPSDMVGLPK